MSKKINYWSFSRLSTYEQCPLQWKYAYLDNLPQEDNIWALIGTLCHEILEDLADKNISNIMAVEWFQQEYDKIVEVHDFPFGGQMLKDSYRRKLSDYFETYTDFQGEIQEIEMNFEIVVNETEDEIDVVRGFVDLPLIYNNEGYVIDHKISTPYTGDTLNKKKKQLYIYAEAYKQKYGNYPSYLMFNYIKNKDKFVEKFNPKYMEFTMNWVRNTIQRIKDDTQFEARIDKGFCSNLCPFRNICPAFKQSAQSS